jgi:AcrR family transcriptional regulator
LSDCSTVIEQSLNKSREIVMVEAGKRDRIFAATVELLWKEGLLAAQTRAVTDLAGVGTGLLNHYFRWPDLRAGAWAKIFEEVAQEMRHADESPVDSLERFFAESFSNAARPLWRLWIEAEGLAAQDPVLALALASARMHLRDVLTAILTDGAACASWTLASPRAVALRLEALRDGLVGLLLAGDAELDAAGAEALLRDTFWRET